MSLKGSKTEQNLKLAFAREAEANRRYVYFASKADIEGHVDIASMFRKTAEAETGHAAGLLEYLESCGDPATGSPMGGTEANLVSAIASEDYESEQLYPEMAQQARDEGHNDIADWFDVLAKAERTHAARFRKELEQLEKKNQ